MRHIAGDSLEHSRIRLERDIDQNIPSPPSMSLDFASPDDDDISSVDLPRHNSRNPSFHSFEHASHLDSDFYSRHGDDDSIALDPELGLTMSTAAHHASALTLSAGLRGRGAYNLTSGRASPSGAEFDPDRPLQAILNNRIADGISVLDAASRSKSQNPTRTLPSFDPLVVDSTAELDRFLRTGHRPTVPLMYPYILRSHSPPVSDASDSDTSPPRLTRALGRDFSPKRPRSSPTSLKDPHSGHSAKAKLVLSTLNPNVNRLKHERAAVQLPAPKDTRKSDPKQPDVTFYASKPSVPSATQRPPLSELGNKHARIRLPDVTGLTSAVQSPVKNDVAYTGVNVPGARTADLLPTLDALQLRLQALERANSVSRRRVRELEHELDGCRAEVLAERTRIEEREREHDVARAKAGRYRAAEDSRYRAVVAEKKALEALLATLRTHLTRLTEELATHKLFLERLRTQTGHDLRAEVHKLRMEVDRLGGEVDRLKAVVEEGLRERRRTKDSEHDGEGILESAIDPEHATGTPAQVGIDLTYMTVPIQGPASTREEALTVADLEPELELELHCDEDEHKERERQKDTDPIQFEQEPAIDPVPEPAPDSVPCTQRYIHASELARVEAEMGERRSERSRSNASQKSRDNDSGNGSSLYDGPPTSDPMLHGHSRTQRAWEVGEEKENVQTISHTPRRSVRATPQARIPFPQIRGSRMERLFFSAPEHNAQTCVVCHRRKRRPVPSYGGERDHQGADVEVDEDLVRAYLRKRAQRSKTHGDGDGEGDRPPPQTVLARVLRELEDDFSHYKAIYLELAEQYGLMDAASNIAKRNVLADHLRDVIDMLEQRGDQIASLYDLLSFKDKPLSRMQH